MATASARDSGVYGVAVDSQAPVSIDGFSNTTQCAYAFSATNLNMGSHSIVVQLNGPSSKVGADASSSGAFELDGFTYVDNGFPKVA